MGRGAYSPIQKEYSNTSEQDVRLTKYEYKVFNDKMHHWIL